ncbi:hypothetical protein [Thalassobaculum sp.]|uniref:hypothetical protein n=1 Tax=Thalassobaculum sp. TaxID=2022740 RepID=UPI0032EFBBB2
MAEKIAILAIDELQKSGVTVTASTTASSSLMPASNVTDYRPGKVWRATGASAEWLQVDHGSSVYTDTVAIIGHNLSLAGTVRVRRSNDPAFASSIYDSGVLDIWPPLYGLGEGGLGRYLGGYVPPGDLGVVLPVRVVYLGAAYGGRYTRVDLSDSNSPIGAVEAGVLMAGVRETFAYNFGHGWQADVVDPSEQFETDAGGTLVLPRTPYDQLSLPFRRFTRSEALTRISTIKRVNGKRKPVLVQLFPDAAPALLYRTTYYGLLSGWSGSEFQAHDVAAQSFTIRGLV